MSRSVDVSSTASTARPTVPRTSHTHVAAADLIPTMSEPDLSTIRAALICASRAPSIHNSQPWKWRRASGGLDLLSEDSRWDAAADPSRMDLLLSCGAVLHHARIAFAALGWSTTVDRMPGSGDPAHLASLHFRRAVPASVTPELLALSAAMSKRFSNRAPYSSWEVPDGIVGVLLKSGTAQGAIVVTVDGEALGAGRSAESALADEDASVFLVIGTEHPDTESLLRAGEAASAILLEATVIGLSTCLISISAEVLGTDRRLRSAITPDVADPCVIVRAGWAHINQRPPQPTPRLPLTETLQP